MSGPITLPTGTDGVMWLVREDLGGEMVVPPDPHGLSLVPPDYFVGTLPYYGDWQIRPIGSPSTLALVIEFETPIQQFRTTAQFVSPEGLKMYAAVEEPTHDPFTGPIFTAVATQAWAPSTSGTRTLTYAAGFRFVILGTIGVSAPLLGLLGLGPTFRNTFFEETIVVPEPVVLQEPEMKLPRGAGRLISAVWPDFQYPGNPAPQNILNRPRLSPEGAMVMIQTQVGAPPAGEGPTYYNALRCMKYPAGNGTGYIVAPFVGPSRPTHIYPALERMIGSNLDGLDEIACWRLVALLAFAQPGGPVPKDCGVFIGAGSNTKIRGDVQAGWSLGLIGPDAIGLTTRQVTGGPQIEHALPLPVGFDITAWHTYEMRILSAMSGTEAQLVIVADDEPLLTLLWGPGTVLPIPQEGASLGFYWGVSNLGGSPDFTTTLYVANGGIQLHAAMTEDALL